MDHVSVICKLAMKWYLMRMCAGWLCPFHYLSRRNCKFCFPEIVDIKIHRQDHIWSSRSWQVGQPANQVVPQVALPPELVKLLFDPVSLPPCLGYPGKGARGFSWAVSGIGRRSEAKYFRPLRARKKPLVPRVCLGYLPPDLVNLTAPIS